MAEKKQGSGRVFKRVTTAPPQAGFFHQNTEGLLLYRTGRAKLNVGGTRLLERIAKEAGMEKGKYGVAFGVPEDEKVVSVYPANTGEEGVVGIRRYKSKVDNAGIHLGGVFLEHPALQAGFDRDCKVSREVDADGVPHLLINLQTAVQYVPTKKAKAAEAEAKKGTNSGDGKSGDGKSGDGKSGAGKSGAGKTGDGKTGDAALSSQ